jgi:hypothetical protein
MRYRYRPAVLEALLRHGVRPTERTPPALVRGFLNDLYRFELRKLRARLLRGEFPRRAYSGLVVELRTRYSLLSLPSALWLEPDAPPARG